MSRSRQHAGFSLVELLMVITILGILAAVAVPSLSPSLHDQLKTAAGIVAEDMAYGASLAVAHNSQYRFTFQPLENRYVLEHNGANPALEVLPQTPFRSPGDPPTRHFFDLDELPRLGTAVSLLTVRTGGASPQTVTDVEFDALGATTRSEETIVWLTTGSGAAARFISVRIDPVTGLAWIGEFQGTRP